MAQTIIPEGVLIGRARVPGKAHPRVVTVRNGEVIDITAKGMATVRDVNESGHAAGHVKAAKGESLGSVQSLLDNSWTGRIDASKPSLLSPIDLQAVKAAGVTFVVSLLERVIEEQARGDKAKADLLRKDILTLVGTDLSQLEPGSPAAMEVKKTLIARGVWSQYLEVGIGPDAEIFTKCQPMATVGYGADVGILPISEWNNPEPELVMVVTSKGEIIGATLGNDVNLRDVEGRSALLLSKAKDNNASAAVGPFIRFLDQGFGLDDIRTTTVSLTVAGTDNFRLEGASSMTRIARDITDLAGQLVNAHHRYPDGAVLFCGTMFAPIDDRDAPGKGFTHKTGDIVTIATPRLGRLVNRIRPTDQCSPWEFGVGALMRNLARRGLL